MPRYNIFAEIKVGNDLHRVMLREHVHEGDGEPQFYTVDEIMFHGNVESEENLFEEKVDQPERRLFESHVITNPLKAFHERIGELMMSANAQFICKGLMDSVVEKESQEDNKKILKLRDRLLKKLSAAIPGIIINGSMENRVCNNLNVSISIVE
jgi:hypothetical protein